MISVVDFPFLCAALRRSRNMRRRIKVTDATFALYKPKLTLGEKRKSRNDGIFAFSPVSGPVFSTAVPYSTMFRRRISFRRNAAGWLNLNSHNTPSSIIHWSLGATAENSLKNKFLLLFVSPFYTPKKNRNLPVNFRITNHNRIEGGYKSTK